MRGSGHSIGDLRGRTALALLMLALLMRVMIPAGWMPAAGSGYAITLCTGTGAVSAWIDKDGNVHKGKPADSKPDQPCAFSGFSAVLDLPFSVGLPLAPISATALIAAKLLAVTIGHGLAAPPPPPTGPPATL